MIGVRRRLFWRVYLTLLASLLAVAFLMGAFWWSIGERQHERWGASHVQLDDWSIPAHDDPVGAVAAATKRLGDELGADISVYDAEGALAASRGAPIPLATERDHVGPLSQIMRVDLPDGRAVVARLRPPGLSPPLRILTIMLIVAGGVGLAAFPITARLTRRLEDLRSGVEQWGAGALSLRLDGAGDDEVAVVARTFNASAARVEALLASQKALLANASHELRSPLARLRLAIELWFAHPSPEMHAEIVRNLAESDQLVEEILLASRLDHDGPTAASAIPVDLLGLAAEEAARIGAAATCVSDGDEPGRSRATRPCCGA